VLDLIGHRIGECGDWAHGRHQVAVAVQKAVQLGERGRAVSAKNGEARGPEGSAGHELGAFWRRGERRPVDVWRLAALAPRDGRIQLVSQGGERIDDGSAFVAELLHLDIESGQPMHQGVPLGLAIDACPEVEPRRHADGQWRRSSRPCLGRSTLRGSGVLVDGAAAIAVGVVAEHRLSRAAVGR
jgi:hypothetical protein